MLTDYVKTMRGLDGRLANVRLELIQEAMEMNYHHAVEAESFQNQPAAFEVLGPALQQIFEKGAPVTGLTEVARQVEQTQVKR